MRKKQVAQETASDIVKYLKDAHKKLQKLETLSPNEQAKLVGVLDSVKNTIDNFDRKKKEQLLQSLIKEKETLLQQGNKLDERIANLQNELG